MEVFVHSEEYSKAYDFANVKPCDNKDKITYCLRVKFTESISICHSTAVWSNDIFEALTTGAANSIEVAKDN